MKAIKFLSIALILILIINLVFFIIGWLNTLWFFIVIIAIGLIAYKGIPYMKKK